MNTAPDSGLRVCMLLHKSVVHDSRVRREANALVGAGHDVTVVELDRNAAGQLDGFARRSAAPPPWVRRRIPFQLYRIVFLLLFVHRIVRLRPQVVHAHDAAMLLPGLIGAKLMRAKLVYDSHELATGVPYRDRRWTMFVGAVERLAVPRAAAVITVSQGIAERIQDRYRLAQRPVVVRNACALPVGPRNGSLRAELGIADAPLVLHQGAAAPDRGCDTLVRAAARLADVHLVFLGTGEPGFDRRLAELADELGTGARVHLRASVPLERLLACTAEADVGVTLLQDTCENHRHALPNKLFEYVAAGVPVVASDLPEMAALVREHGVGWVTDSTMPAATAATLELALAHREDGELRARLRNAAAKLRWDVEAAALTDLYERLGGDQRCRDGT